VTCVTTTASDFVVSTDGELPPLADRAKHYRALAALLLARLESIKTAEARAELQMLAERYQRLAEQVEQSAKLTAAYGSVPASVPADQRRQLEGSD